MRPLILKGHSRPLTHIVYNSDGDLLFSSSKDAVPTAWFAETGERLGTYNGHKGAVWYVDVNFDSTLLLTGSGDATAKLWDVETGKELFTFVHKSAVRCVNFAEGDEMFLSVGDHSMGQKASIFIYPLAKDVADQEDIPRLTLSGHTEKISRALWGNLNQTILSCSDDCSVKLWDVETGTSVVSVSDHRKGINNMSLSQDKTMLITASKDHTVRLYDTRDLTCLKTYRTDQPVNAAVLSPIKSHIIVGGGQEAMSVTTTDTKSGKFEAHFYHLVYENWLGSLQGHFGPINALAISPSGKSYASGAEDGYIRIHHFDDSYFSIKLD